MLVSSHTLSEDAAERLLLLGCQAKKGFVNVHEPIDLFGSQNSEPEY